MSTPGFTTDRSFKLDSLVFGMVKNGVAGSTFSISDASTPTVTFPISHTEAEAIGFLVQGSELHVGKVVRNGCSFQNESLIANRKGSFAVLRDGGGIGISDLRDGATKLMHLSLDKAPIMIYLEDNNGMLFIHLLALDLANGRADHCFDTFTL